MKPGMVLVHFSWDSGPYSTTSRISEEEVQRDPYFARKTREVPLDVVERWEKAEAEFREAEEELEKYDIPSACR